jgi:hypothetical protein
MHLCKGLPLKLCPEPATTPAGKADGMLFDEVNENLGSHFFDHSALTGR